MSDVSLTADGNKIIIPDKEHSKARSDKMTTRVADRIKDPGFGEVKQTIMQPTVINVSNEDESVNVEDPLIVPERGSIEVLDGKELHREPKEGELTLAVMEKMETSELLKIINTNMDLMEAMQILPGKNTNKKLREIIFAHQEGRLAELLPNPEDTSIVIDKVIDVSKGEIPLNKAFDQQKADKAADDFLNGPSKPKEETREVVFSKDAEEIIKAYVERTVHLEGESQEEREQRVRERAIELDLEQYLPYFDIFRQN